MMADSLPYRNRSAADPDDRSGEVDDDEEEEVDETGYKTVKDAVLFAIDVSKSMLTRPPPSSSKKADRSSPLLATLKCAYHFMQQRIISNPRDMMGILLYNTEISKFYDENESTRGGLSYPHCYLLTDLNVPEAEDVKSLKRLVESDSEEEKAVLRPSERPVAFQNVLFCANQVFQTKAPNFSSRRLFIVTDNDSPHGSNKGIRSSAAVRAKDLYDLGVTIELFPISTPSHTFDPALFYDDIIYRSTPSDPDAILYNPTSAAEVESSNLKSGSTDGISLLESLLSKIASKTTPKRTLFSSVPLELAPNLRISVKGYLLYKRQAPARSCYIYLGSERPQIAKGSTTQVADEDTRTVEKSEIRKAYTFGGEQVSFAPEEISKLRNFGDPVIRVIGFKPISLLPMWANVKQSTFLYPSEDDFVGSTRVFAALHGKLLSSSLFALTWFVPRRNAAPVMAALVATLLSAAPSNPSSVSPTSCPQGLHLIPLPFADDIRIKPPFPHSDPIIHAPESLVDLMRPIVQQLNLPGGIYNPSKYPNPSLQWHYRILQALALEEDVPNVPEDRTLPKYKQIDKRVGQEATDWGIELENVHAAHLKEHPNAGIGIGSKRAAPGDSASGAAKRVKTDVPAAEGLLNTTSEDEMRRLWQKGQLNTLLVGQLKDFVGLKRVPGGTSGKKKAELVESIEAWFERK